jgi:hypothetical protein
MRYTYDDDDDFASDGLSTRRSTRNATPADTGPVVTSSGRQVKSRVGGLYGESLSTDQRREYETGEAESEGSADDMPASAPTRGARRASRARQEPSRLRERYDDGDDMDTESDGPQDDGEEWSGDENEPDDDESEGDATDDEEVDDDAASADEGDMQRSLVVQLRYRPTKAPVPPSSRARTPLPPTEIPTNGITTGAEKTGDTSVAETSPSGQENESSPIQSQEREPEGIVQATRPVPSLSAGASVQETIGDGHGQQHAAQYPPQPHVMDVS